MIMGMMVMVLPSTKMIMMGMLVTILVTEAMACDDDAAIGFFVMPGMTTTMILLLSDDTTTTIKANIAPISCDKKTVKRPGSSFVRSEERRSSGASRKSQCPPSGVCCHLPRRRQLHSFCSDGP